MSDLQTIAGSQRGVWEELGSVVPCWSVLARPAGEAGERLGF